MKNMKGVTHMKKILSAMVILPVMLVVSCFASPSENDNTTQEVVVLGAVALAMSSRTIPPVGSCNFAASGSCIEYYTGWTASQMTADCATGSGTFTSGATFCATTSRVGSCVLVGRGVGTIVSGTTATVRYYSSNFTTGSAQTNCNVLPGTFTAN
jgi:NAD/NADP transhydrogenase beta subunit